jgi:hypothetical protein
LRKIYREFSVKGLLSPVTAPLIIIKEALPPGFPVPAALAMAASSP